MYVCMYVFTKPVDSILSILNSPQYHLCIQVV